MRKIVIAVILLFSLGFYLVNSAAAEKIDLRLDDEIGVAFLNKNMILVMGEDESTLLVLGEDSLNNLYKFYHHNLNVLMLREMTINVEAKNRLVLDDEHEIGDVKYSLENGLIRIHYEDTNICVYMGGAYNISTCQFVYFYDTNISDLTVYDYNEVILYYYKSPLPTKVLENIYEQSVDTYPLRDDELTIIKVGEEDYDFIVIDNE